MNEAIRPPPEELGKERASWSDETTATYSAASPSAPPPSAPQSSLSLPPAPHPSLFAMPPTPVPWTKRLLAWLLPVAAAALGMTLVLLAFSNKSNGTLFTGAAGHLGLPLEKMVTSVDGAPACQTPRCLFDLKPGMHEVTVRADGYVPQSQLVVVRSGEPLALNIRLERARSELKVAGQPEGATLIVDGERAGRLPQQLDLSPGPHRLHLEADGYVSEDRDIELAAGETKAMTDVALQPTLAKATEKRSRNAEPGLWADSAHKDHDRKTPSHLRRRRITRSVKSSPQLP
ncbi:MAG TPA: PEGA domain-containing protein [Polyangiaceae bacterium]